MQILEGHIVDIVGKRIFDGRICVRDGVIASVQECSLGSEGMPYILPGFIDSHVHIESSMLTPREFARSAVEYGITGVVTDPHEIANVLGVKGVEFMIEDASLTNFNFCFGAPSCVPSCGGSIETAGAVLTSKDVEYLLRKPELGLLSEMMNVPGVLGADPEVLRKIEIARSLGKNVDGHAPGLTAQQRARYAAAGISTDHECTTYAQGRECLESGMYLIIREGSAARDFDALSPLIDEYPDRIMFCTDDIHPGDGHEGTILSSVRKSLALGYDLWNVLRAASLTPQEHYGLNWGLLREGDPANFIEVDSLSADMKVLSTYIQGESVKVADTAIESYPNCFRASKITCEDIKVPDREEVPVIVAFDGKLYTDCEYARPDDKSYPWSEVQKIVVINRYQEGAAPSVGYIRGFNLTDGAMGVSVAHDCHNIVAIGSSDENIVKVVNSIVEMKGGIAATVSGQEPVILDLPIAGLMSTLDRKGVSSRIKSIISVARSAGCTMKSPLITMSFMCLPVIPKLKITDKGVFDVMGWKFV